MNLLDLFAIPLQRSPDKVVLRFRDEEGAQTDLTTADLFADARRIAAGLAARGVGPGDRVAFFLGNGPEFVTALLALFHLGAVLVPINLAYRRREITHMLADAGPRLLLTERSWMPILDELAAEERAGVEMLFAEELSAWPEDPGFVPSRVDGSDLAMLLYTSGTTGRSKGAMISHDNVLATVTGLLAAWDWQPDDVLLLTLPLFHTHGLVVGLCCALAAGATVLLRRRFDAATTAAELRDGGPTLFFGVPTMYVRLVEELGRVEDRSGHLSGLGRMRLFCSGSAPLAPETFAAFRDLTGHSILERYGMTETGMNLSNPYAGLRLPGTVGTPLPGVSARIAADGELLVRGGNVFSGYWRAPEKTAESFVPDPPSDGGGQLWFRTGDLASRDPQTGYFSLLGRRHELILSGGFNVYPREVEEVLTSFPGVREAAVVGRPHPEWGEVPVAFLVMEGEGRTVDEAGLIAFCKSRIAGFKVPRTFHVIDALPRNALGKVQKHLLPALPA
ncbi:MAG TPA: AMP-binding protein [Thermoanaerobaculia bacterium]|nr:AMP-binding protein [Thermoanaerobaculia bacterium]